MLIHEEMCLDALIALIGERHGVSRAGAARYASQNEALDLRDLLVRDFDGQNTDELSITTWNSYCCAIDPHN